MNGGGAILRQPFPRTKTVNGFYRFPIFLRFIIKYAEVTIRTATRTKTIVRESMPRTKTGITYTMMIAATSIGIMVNRSFTIAAFLSSSDSSGFTSSAQGSVMKR
jgi:hypothetical protein